MSDVQEKQERVIPVSAVIRAHNEIAKSLQGAAQRGELGNLVAMGILQIVTFQLSSSTGLTADEITGMRGV